ncbi:MAG: CotH kinase family protein, partial [Promethearchaeota archaeon]
IPLILISLITLSSFIYFSYQDSTGSIVYSSEVPNINIDVSGQITNESIQCSLKISPYSTEFTNTGWANRYLPANIRRRISDGGLSFELYQNENLFEIREDDDWLLLPQGKYLDSLRTKLAFDVFNMIYINNPYYRLPQSKLIEVFINGNYEGLYLLCERVDRKMMDLELEDTNNPEENDAIFKTNNWDGDFYSVPTATDPLWEQLYPNILDFSDIPKNLTEFIHNATEADFFNNETGIFSIFDKNSIIDNFLFSLLTGHEIIEGSSCYLALNQKMESGFFFLPWDFGQSWGFSKHGSIPLSLWLNENQNAIESVVWSKLYHRLVLPNNPAINDEFMAEIINRWNFLKNYFWNSVNLTVYFEELSLPIQNALLRAENSEDMNTIVDTIKEWILTRCSLLNNILVDPYNMILDNLQDPIREDDEIFGFSSPAARRNYFKSSELFSKTKIHEVRVVIRADYFSDILNRKHDIDRWNDRRFMPSDVSIDGYSMDNTGFRVRANYNKVYPKDSFKLKFSEREFYLGNGAWRYMPENADRRFCGLRRLNLRAAPVDFSFMNEVAGYELYNILGMPCPRISWAKLFITKTDEAGNILEDEVYSGLYLLTEDIDKTFLNYNFKKPEGNLYKTNDYATLEFVPQIQSLLTLDGRRNYELRTNEELDDYSDLQKFVQYINYNWSNIQEVTNITLLGKYFAASVFQANWDDYVFLPHNYYLYSDPQFGFVMIPWDVENNFNMGSNYSIQGYVTPFAPDFREAPLLSGYKEWYPWISEFFGINPDNRPFWDNLIVDSDFIFAFYNSLQKIVDNMSSLYNQVVDWFNFIDDIVTLPYTHTDPEPDPRGAWIPDEILEGWFWVGHTRVLNYLVGRTQYVISQLP